MHELSGVLIPIKVERVTVSIPVEWQRRFETCGDNLYLGSARLDFLRSVEGEWDVEFTRVLNAMLAHEHAVAHLGIEPFGSDGSFYSDLSVRLYLSSEDPSAIIDRLASEALLAARMFDAKARILRRLGDEWISGQLTFDLFYGDYGGTAVVSAHSKRCADQTLTVAFLFEEHFWKDTDFQAQVLRGIHCSS